MDGYLVRQSPIDAPTTMGMLYVGGEMFYTLEPPWRDNQRNRSCIPNGTYRGVHLPRSASGKYRDVYLLDPVPGRSGILIHAGNLLKHTLGCVLLGTYMGSLQGQPAVLASRTAMAKFNDIVAEKELTLYVRGGERNVAD